VLATGDSVVGIAVAGADVTAIVELRSSGGCVICGGCVTGSFDVTTGSETTKTKIKARVKNFNIYNMIAGDA